jgi:hypothetical protein
MTLLLGSTNVSYQNIQTKARFSDRLLGLHRGYFPKFLTLVNYVMQDPKVEQFWSELCVRTRGNEDEAHDIFKNLIRRYM